MYAAKPLKERFAGKYAVNAATGCWDWTAALLTTGYGLIGLGGKYGRGMRAHRASWEIHCGPIPDGLWVLHKCDNRRCVNPDHLFLGTRKDNISDMVQKGRSLFGTRSRSAILTVAAVADIFRSKGKTLETARKYGVSRQTIMAIRAGRRWSRITKEIAA